jgi:hypothetical protein
MSKLSKLDIHNIKQAIRVDKIAPEIVAAKYNVHLNTIYYHTEDLRREEHPRKDRKDKGKPRPERTKDFILNYVKGLVPKSAVEKRDKKHLLNFLVDPLKELLFIFKY